MRVHLNQLYVLIGDLTLHPSQAGRPTEVTTSVSKEHLDKSYRVGLLTDTVRLVAGGLCLMDLIHFSLTLM